MFSRLVFSLVLVVIFLILINNISSWLISFSEILGSASMAKHIMEIARVFNQSSTLLDIERFNLILTSLKAFTISPFFGTYIIGSSTMPGGHSTFFDILGGCGILGFIPYCGMIISYYEMIQYKIKVIQLRNLWKVISIMFFILQIMNPIISNYEISFTYMFIIPCAIFYLQERIQKSENCSN